MFSKNFLISVSAEHAAIFKNLILNFPLPREPLHVLNKIKSELYKKSSYKLYANGPGTKPNSI